LAVKRGAFHRLYYVSREISGQDLYAFLSGDASASTRTGALRRAGVLIRSLHERGVLHADLHPKNFFVAEGTGDVLILDLDQTERGEIPARDARVENLVRFYRFGRRREDLGEGRGWSEDELRALLEGYGGGDAGNLEAEILRSYRRSSWLHRIGWRLEKAFAGR
jgi:Ser/Thr protein kinase RdoA (MazF antagonist)